MAIRLHYRFLKDVFGVRMVADYFTDRTQRPSRVAFDQRGKCYVTSLFAFFHQILISESRKVE
jgi:hypothetical protein